MLYDVIECNCSMPGSFVSYHLHKAENSFLWGERRPHLDFPSRDAASVSEWVTEWKHQSFVGNRFKITATKRNCALRESSLKYSGHRQLISIYSRLLLFLNISPNLHSLSHMTSPETTGSIFNNVLLSHIRISCCFGVFLFGVLKTKKLVLDMTISILTHSITFSILAAIYQFKATTHI